MFTGTSGIFHQQNLILSGWPQIIGLHVDVFLWDCQWLIDDMFTRLSSCLVFGSHFVWVLSSCIWYSHPLSVLCGGALSCFESYPSGHLLGVSWQGQLSGNSPALHWGCPRISTGAYALCHIHDLAGANHSLARCFMTPSCTCRFPQVNLQSQTKSQTDSQIYPRGCRTTTWHLTLVKVSSYLFSTTLTSKLAPCLLLNIRKIRLSHLSPNCWYKRCSSTSTIPVSL